MGVRTFGNQPLYSTTASTGSTPSTTTIAAQIQGLASELYEVRFVVGASTLADWRLEHALSSALGSTAIRQQTVVYTASGQSGEFILTYKAESGDRFRVIPNSSFTGTFACDISAEVMA